MRVVYLTLGLFILLGVGATCRTPPLLPQACVSGPASCETERPNGHD